VTVSDDLWRVLKEAQDMAQKSGGAFDVTVGPVVRLWRRARIRRQLPSPERMKTARQKVGYKLIRLHPESQQVELLEPDMLLDLGGIAKGYAADEALAVLRKHGIRRALVDAGGDIVLGDPPPGRPAWRIGVAPLDDDAPPSQFLALANVAVATSGDAWQHVVIDGVRYSHIIDPRTGTGLTDHSSVTVVARDGITADALASAVSVLGPEKGIELVEKTCGAAAFIVRAPEGKVQTYQSAAWKDLPKADPGKFSGGATPRARRRSPPSARPRSPDLAEPRSAQVSRPRRKRGPRGLPCVSPEASRGRRPSVATRGGVGRPAPCAGNARPGKKQNVRSDRIHAVLSGPAR
jgi:thiamine biosynthesis lipoprotein